MLFRPKRKSRAHQLAALDAMRDKKNFALLAAMRTGKTHTIVCDFGRRVLEGELRQLLVIAPAGAYMPWAAAIAEDFPDEMFDRTDIFTWVSKYASRRSTKDALEAFIKSNNIRVLVVNIEAISAVPSARALCEQFLKHDPKRSMMVIDESVVIKNSSSVASKFCVETLSPLAEYKRILSGLVSPRSPLDVYQQFRFLSKNIFPETYDKFRDRYAIVKRICTLPQNLIRQKFINALKLNAPSSEVQLRAKALLIWPDMTEFPEFGFLHSMVMNSPNTEPRDNLVATIFRAGRYVESIPVIEGYRNTSELHNRIAPYSFRVRLEDVTDMPPSSYTFRDVKFHPDQERIYAELKALATAELENEKHVTAVNVVSQMMKLHQVLCGHAKDEDGEVIPVPEYRTAALIELLDDYDGKAIIWCSYDADVRKITGVFEKHFGEGCVARFWGGNRDTREDEEKLFKSDDTCRFMVATAAAGGRGRTWDNADLVIYYSCTNNLDHRAQSEERAKNVGKTRPVAYIDLRVPDTVEDKILFALRNKIDLAAVINGDNYKDWLV